MKTWDIFCRVIDNYGDIGVCWRLARQLVDEHKISVRLWVDEIAALKHIWPDATFEQVQSLAGVTVCIWPEDFQVDAIQIDAIQIDTIQANGIPDVVIEAFACHLPDVYVAAMLQANPQPIWLNLEYLSAESWVEGCHQLSSMHPQNGLKKTFYFPGFSEKTGGILREQDLLLRRDSFNASHEKESFLTRIGVTPQAETGLLISLFSYENTAIEGLLKAWSQSSLPVQCLVPAGKTLVSINSACGMELGVGDSFSKGSLTLQVIPFLTQVDYDQLLWACDINFIRGEDSFVRAQWAAKPFVWHIYPQEEDAHLIKLNAFLDKYLQATDPELSGLISHMWLAWNNGEDCAKAWENLLARYDDWREQSRVWCQNLSAMPDLATNLVHFCQKVM